jgi:hypothetical protein
MRYRINKSGAINSNFSNPAEKAQHDKLVALVENML